MVILSIGDSPISDKDHKVLDMYSIFPQSQIEEWATRELEYNSNKEEEM
jgi:hypothetical protein